MGEMEALLVVPAALAVAVVGVIMFRARAHRVARVVDLVDPPAPVVDLEYLQSRAVGQQRQVTAPVTGEKSLGARLLAADRARQHERNQAPRRRHRGEQLVADR